jgi:hypothetical protein
MGEPFSRSFGANADSKMSSFGPRGSEAIAALPFEHRERFRLDVGPLGIRRRCVDRERSRTHRIGGFGQERFTAPPALPSAIREFESTPRELIASKLPAPGVQVRDKWVCLCHGSRSQPVESLPDELAQKLSARPSRAPFKRLELL